MKPYVICHMIASVDGRIDCDMTEKIEPGDEYNEALDKLECPSLLMGRVTMLMHFAAPQPFVCNDNTPISRTTWHKAKSSKGYCIGVDTMGKLRWDSNEYESLPLLIITSEDCPKAYHEILSAQGISWIAVGEGGIDFQAALNILYDEFGVERLVVTGGGNINGAFLNAGLLDEVSLMIAPGIDGRAGMTAVFDGLTPPEREPVKLNLLSVERLGQTVWMRYDFNV